MRKIILIFLLVYPAAAMAEPCDMTIFRDIDQRFIAAAPSCIESGDYNSHSCNVIRALQQEGMQAAASVKAVRCEDVPYDEDPRIAPLREKVLVLQDAAWRGQRLDAKTDSFSEPESTPGGHDNGVDVCTRLLKDIEQKYDFSGMRLLANQGDMSVFYPIMPCTYEAVRTTIHGDMPVVIEATINLSNRRYRIKVY
jgi:hypothetical protein